MTTGTETMQPQADIIEAQHDIAYGINPDAFGNCRPERTSKPIRSVFKDDFIAAPYPQTEQSNKHQTGLLLGALWKKTRLIAIPLALVTAFFMIPVKESPNSAALVSSNENQDEPVSALNQAPAHHTDTPAELLTTPHKAEEMRPGSSEEIVHFLAPIQVNGVLHRGEKSKITLDGRTYKIGETISTNHELKFMGFDENSRNAVFVDPLNDFYLIELM